MKNASRFAVACASLLVTAGAIARPATSQVRVESPQGVVEVSPNWRSAGTHYRSADTARILVELGAVEEGDAVRLALGGDVLFDFGSAAIRADAAEQLAKVAHLVRQKSVGQVLVVGHTDSVGGAAANQRLSEARASAVVAWLSHNEGIPGTVLRSRGMGSSKPVAYNMRPDGSDNPAGRALNRRVEFLLATRAGVDLAQRAETVIRIGDGEIDIGGGEVRVKRDSIVLGGPGGVEVTGTGVRIGADVADDEDSGGDVMCDAGESCRSSCPAGDCSMACSASASCHYSCSGGDCTMRCAKGATCEFSCSGGGCTFVCPKGSSCHTSCSAGGCTRT